MNNPDPDGIYARWIMKLQPFDIEVIIKPGRKHNNVDALSRVPYNTPHFVEKLPKRGPVAWARGN